jgi:hypothetical protein
VVLIQKLDGSICFFIDYRKLNAVNENYSYALTHVDDYLDALEDERYLTTLDANCGYWQIDVNETDREKKAFPFHKACISLSACPLGS